MLHPRYIYYICHIVPRISNSSNKSSQHISYFLQINRLPFCLHVKKYRHQYPVKHKAFIYDSIETNAGNAHNSATGKFTTPGYGMYVFHTTTPAYDKSYCIIEIVKNVEIKDIGFVGAGE